MDIKNKVAEIICKTHLTPIEQSEQIDELYKQAQAKQLIITEVVASLPSKEEMYLKELQEFKEVVKVDAAVSRIDFGAGFVKCYNWIAETLKNKG
jgi:hypothetical protein